MDIADQKSFLSSVFGRLRPVLDSKMGPFVLLLIALIALSWILQIVGYAVGAFEQPSPMVEMLTGPVYTTVLVVFTVIALWLSVDAVERDRHSRAQEYANAYEEVAKAYKDAGDTSEALARQMRLLMRSHALTRVFVSISEREREIVKDFKIAETALRGGDLSRAQEAIDRLDSNRMTVDHFLMKYFPSHSDDGFKATLDEREVRIEGEDECPSTSARLKFKELKIVQPKWTKRFRATMSRLENEIDFNRDEK